MGKYWSRMFLIFVTGMVTELFLPPVTGGTSIDREIAVIMPVYSFLHEEGMEAGKTPEKVPEKVHETAPTETMTLLALADLDAETENGPDEGKAGENGPDEDGADENGPDEDGADENGPDGGGQDRSQSQEVSLELYQSYEELVKNFYTIDSNTAAGQELLNVDKLLQKDMRLEDTGAAEGPQILIYHTHSLEAYADSDAGDPADSVMGVGERLTQILEEEYGYRVLHCTEQFDVENRNQAYAKALPVLQRILEENPTIQVMIDLHRDEMPQGTRLVTEIDGKPTARFMFFNGLSRTRKTGDISYLKNENLDGNLAFSFRLQVKCMEYYPGLARKIYLKGYRYNLHLLERSLLVEMGAQNNTVEEAMNACGPLAHVLHMVLSR